jgi:hypothetical protein
LDVAVCVAGLDFRKGVVMIYFTPISSQDEGDDYVFEDEDEDEGFDHNPSLVFRCGGSMCFMVHRLVLLRYVQHSRVDVMSR